ncbi:MAG TPA: hypothetical protein VHC90_05330, partial [Bryobacteraceae bacterium]|nr:hypothetical protein [Bryobacteraceae bacterium]
MPIVWMQMAAFPHGRCNRPTPFWYNWKFRSPAAPDRKRVHMKKIILTILLTGASSLPSFAQG